MWKNLLDDWQLAFGMQPHLYEVESVEQRRVNIIAKSAHAYHQTTFMQLILSHILGIGDNLLLKVKEYPGYRTYYMNFQAGGHIYNGKAFLIKGF